VPVGGKLNIQFPLHGRVGLAPMSAFSNSEVVDSQITEAPAEVSIDISDLKLLIEHRTKILSVVC